MELVYPNERRLFTIALVIAMLAWLVLVVGTIGIALLYIGLIFLIGLFVQASFISYVKGSGVLITPEQYPDFHQQLLQCCSTLGVKEVPDTYLLRTDFFNALATRFLRRHYIVLFTDVVDALQDQPEALRFYLGHELGHIHRRHIYWGWILAPALLLPLLGSAFRRAQEYTCDRYGNACCASSADATAALAAIVAGDSRWQTMNIPAYLRQVQGTGGFWMSLNELTAEYPWLSKRMAWVVALREKREPQFPRRHPLAWLLSAFVPSIPGGTVSLLLLVAILGVLAAVALPAYQSYQETVLETQQQALDAQQSLAEPAEVVSYPDVATLEYGAGLTQANLSLVLAELSPLRVAVEQYYADNAVLPQSLSSLGLEQESVASTHGNMPIRVYEDGILLVGFGDSPDGGVFLINQPVVDSQNQLEWFCLSQFIDPDLLPSQCHN